MSTTKGSGRAARLFGGLSIGIGALIALLAVSFSLFLIFSLSQETDPHNTGAGVAAIVMFGAIPLLIGGVLLFIGRKLRRPSSKDVPAAGGYDEAEQPELLARPTDRLFGISYMIIGATIVLVAAHLSLVLILVSAEHPTYRTDEGIAYGVLAALGLMPIVIGGAVFLRGQWLYRKWHAAHLKGNSNRWHELGLGSFRRGFGTVLVGWGAVIVVMTGLVILSGIAFLAFPSNVNMVVAIAAAIYFWYRGILYFLLFIGLELLGSGLYLRHRSKVSVLKPV